MIGQTFGELTLIHFHSMGKNSSQKWLVRCNCGTELVVFLRHVKEGHTRSCGCLKVGNTTHEQTDSKEYHAWAAMKQRCDNPDNQSYDNYGGRGISYDPAWESFENFLADMDKAPIGLTLERIDNDKGYCKSNCKWATRREQNNNTRRNTARTFATRGYQDYHTR